MNTSEHGQLDDNFPMSNADQQRTRHHYVVQVAPGVTCVQLPIVNVYLVEDPQGGWTLVDGGLGIFAHRIISAAKERFGDRPPNAIVLTHGHFDHIGALPLLLERWHVPLYTHTLEMPYLTGRSNYPPPDPAVGGGIMALSSLVFPRRATDFGDRVEALPPDGSVPGLSQWRWIHTPGHSPGHVSFFRSSDKTLIVGDAFVTTRQESAIAALTGLKVLSRPPAYFTPDWETARRSVAKLAQLEPELAASGHGPAMRGIDLRLQLEQLLANWEKYAVPRYGRYVRSPAVMDERGTVRVPPPAVNPWHLAGIIGLVAGAYALSRRHAATLPS